LRGNLYGFGRGDELEDEITAYGTDGFTATPLPSGDQSPFIHKGNLTSYIFEKGTLLPGDYHIGIITKDNSVTGLAPESHMWPLLGISEDSISWPAPTTQSSINLPQLLVSQSQQIYEKEVPGIIERMDCYEPLTLSQQDTEIDAEIMGAGYNYSNLHTGYFTGICQLEIVLRYEISGTFDPEVDAIPFDYIGIKSMSDQSYTDSNAIDLSSFDYAALLSEEENYLTLSLNYLLLGGNFDTSPWALNIALLKKNGTNNYSIYKNEWPVLNIYKKSGTKKYISAGVVGQDPDGSYSDPFGSVSEALTWFDKYFNGTIDKEHPVELIMLPGEHEVTKKKKITLPTYYELWGEPGAIIELPNNEPFGSYVELGHGSTLKNLTIECGVKCEHSRAYVDNCIFKLSSGASPKPLAALIVTGHHDLHVRNCLFVDQKVSVFADGESVLSISNCTFADCEGGLALSGESISKVSNCIFYNISNASESATAVLTQSEAYAYVENSAFYGNDKNFNELEDSELNCISSTLVTSNPLFVDVENKDYHLTQTTCRNFFSGANTSPCVNSGAWNGFISGSTSIDNARDFDQNDIGYHYPAEQSYNFPRFKADDGTSTDYTSRIAIYNPTEYTQSLSLSCYNMAGTLMDFNGSEDGNALEFQLEAGHTWYRILSDSCTPGNDECLEAPCAEGSIIVTSDGPLFGQYRIIEENATTGTNSWMLQMQRTDLADTDGGITTLSCDTFVTNFGGYNTIESEVVLHNLSDETTTVVGTVYNNLGTPIPSDSFTEFLSANESKSLIFDSSSTIDYGNMEINASAPITGELIYHCQNTSSNHRFSEGVIMVPSTFYSDTLTAPFLLIENYGSQYQESYICLKNPNNNSVSVNVDVFNEYGVSIYSGGTPTPTPLPLAPHGSDCISSYDFPNWGSYSVEFDVIGSDKIIGHNEIVLYDTSYNDLGMAGCELDHHLAMPDRYFVPYCALNDQAGQEYETTWVGLRNNNPTTTAHVDLTITALDGTPLDGTTITIDPRHVYLFSFGNSPALLDPGTENQFSLEIESDNVLSGWAEIYRNSVTGDDMAYDANKLHSW